MFLRPVRVCTNSWLPKKPAWFCFVSKAMIFYGTLFCFQVFVGTEAAFKRPAQQNDIFVQLSWESAPAIFTVA